MSHWVPVPGYVGRYEISDEGEVRSLVPKYEGRHFKAKIGLDTGYPEVGLTDAAGIRRHHRIHTLVLTAFVGPRPAGMVTRHLNGSRDDNRLANLAWGTYKENYADAVLHGTRSGVRASRKTAQVPKLRVREAATKCKRGHDLAVVGVWVTPDGKKRRCRACRRIYKQTELERRRERRALAAEAEVRRLTEQIEGR